jgi:hypothetical protein
VLVDLKDPDGMLFIKERIELARQQSSFWQNYKFMNPVTKQVEPKQMYCESSTKPWSAAASIASDRSTRQGFGYAPISRPYLKALD